ncbi:MAG: alpha/beta hydrolase [Gemmataceae bacterium]|nr:alpha/beta hydrolase [Gemmataceae bacterium]
MRLVFFVSLILVAPSLARAQEPRSLVIRLAPAKIGVAVLLENISKKPIMLRDQSIPSFHAYTWLRVHVDDKPASLTNDTAFALGLVERTIQPGERMAIGNVALALPPVGSFPAVHDVAPGDRILRVSLAETRRQGNALDNVESAALTVAVPIAEAGAADLPATYAYKKVGSLPIHAEVYRLPGNEVRPVIVWIHGGALITGHRAALRAEQRKRYLDTGFVVVAIDYRLAPETKLASIIDDLKDAFTWVRDKGPTLCNIDPNRLAVVGHSAGGYLTLMSGFAVEPRPKALVAFYGYGDITNEWYAKPDVFYRTRPLVPKDDAYKAIGKVEIAAGKDPARGKFYLYCRQNGLWPKEVVGHDPDKEPRAFDRFCPIRNVTKSYPPTLFLHGTADTDVPYRQSVDMAAELKKHGIPNEVITIKDGPHGFDGKGLADPRNAEAFDRVIAFLRERTVSEPRTK